MTIDKSTKILVDRYIDTYVVCGGANYNPAINITREDCEAFQVAISTMRKYQKIEQILQKKYDKGICEESVNDWYSMVKSVREVLGDGKDD